MYEGPERRELYPGRREADRNVCIYHDLCHETMGNIKQELKDHIKDQKEVNKLMEQANETKVPNWVFRLFLSTFIPLAIIILGWVGYQAFETNKVVVRLDTNQIQLMKVFDIDPKAKPE